MTDINKPVISISIPTGIGANQGGYAGDFGYIARKFSEFFHLIINPNAVNGGILSAINSDMSYLEGWLFDEFLKGNIGIIPKKNYQTNKIGIIFDKAIPDNIMNIHINTLNALKMVQGMAISQIEITKEEVGVEIKIENNISYGNIKNSDTLLDSAKKLIKGGAEAIAVVCYFGEDCENEDYENGAGIDPIGGAEAIISHLIAKEFKIPAAHAPAFKDIDISQKIENEKVSSELISSTYLPCIIQGLATAPDITTKHSKDAIFNRDVKYHINTADAMGNPAVLSCIKNNIPIAAVKNNSVLNVTPKKLNIENIEFYETYEKCLKSLRKKISV